MWKKILPSKKFCALDEIFVDFVTKWAPVGAKWAPNLLSVKKLFENENICFSHIESFSQEKSSKVFKFNNVQKQIYNHLALIKL